MSKISFFSDTSDRSLKLIVLGDVCEGVKRDLLISLTNPKYPEEYLLKHEFDPHFYYHKYSENNVIINYTVSLFDSTGIEDAPDIIKIMCRNASVIIYVYSATEPSSLENLESKWIPNHKDLLNDIPFIVVCINGILRDDKPTAQKLGRKGIRMVKKSKGEFLSQKLGAVSYVECEIVPRLNIEYAFSIAINAGIKHKLGISIEPPGLYIDFCKHGQDFELQELFDAKNANINKVQNSESSPFLIALKSDNICFAAKLLELSGGIGSLANGNYDIMPPVILEWCRKGILKELNLNNNNILYLPIEFCYLKHCSLEENPLISLPKEIRREKWPKIKKYLEYLKERAISMNIRKLMLLGNSGIGKSSFIKAIGGKSIDSKVDRTKLDILELKVKSSGKENIIFKIWDFGNNLINNPTHKYFITHGAIYTICFNFNDYDNSNLEYWFKLIKEYAGNLCAIILIGTHADLISDDEIEKISNNIKTKFPRIRFPAFTGEIIPISSKTGLNIKKIKEILINIAMDSTMRVSASERSWVQLDELIHANIASGLEFVKHDSFLKWCETCNINENIDSVRDFLTKVGSIIHYSNLIDPIDGKIHEIYLLKPSWIIDIIDKLVLSTGKIILSGFSLQNAFDSIFSSTRRSLIYGLLSKYNTIHYIKQKKRFLIPFLLPKEKKLITLQNLFPSKIPENIRTLGRIYSFNQLPLDFIGLVMVWILRIPEITDTYTWNKGMTILYSNINDIKTNQSYQIPVLFEYNSQDEFSIYLRYTENLWTFVHKAWRKIIECIRTMIESYFPRLLELTNEYIPCSHCFKPETISDIVYRFRYEDCVNLMLNHDSKSKYLYCNNIESPSRFVPLFYLCPDIGLVDFPIIIEDNLIIKSQIGKGAFGVVYKAILNNEDVALKELVLSQVDEFVNKQLFIDFQVECYIMRNLNHPNIIKFYGIRLNPLGMIIELITGKDLFQFMHKEDNNGESLISLNQSDFPWDIRIKIATDIVNGLHYLQMQKPPIIHRDLRSPNIFLRANNDAVIGDFGLAREVYNTVGGILASWQWVAPECLNSLTKTYDIRSDIYSFGIVLWELAAIALPFGEYASDPLYFNKNRGTYKLQELKQAIIEDHLRPTIPSDTPLEFANLIRKCWKHKPSERPSTLKIIKILKKIGGSGINKSNKDIPVKIIDSIVTQRNILPPILPRPLSKHYIREPESNGYTCSIGDNNKLWIGLDHGSIHSFELQNNNTWKKIKTWQAQTKLICSLLLINDKLWSYSEDSTIKVWETDTFALHKEWAISDHSESGTLLLTSNNFIWVSKAYEGSIIIYNQDYSIHHTIVGEMSIGSLYMTEHNGMVWVSSGKKTNKIALFNVTTFEYLGEFIAHISQIGGILSLSPLPLVCTFSPSSIKIWGGSSISNLNCVKTSNIQSSVTYALFSKYKDTKSYKLLVASYNGIIIQYNPETLKPEKELEIRNESKDIRGMYISNNNYFTVIAQKLITIWSNEFML